MSTTHKGVVLLDRDGVINKVTMGRYVNTPEDLVLYPGAASAIRQLNKGGFYVGLVTNQGGISRGYLTESMLHNIHVKLHGLLDSEGAKADYITWCSHKHDCDHCICRKPKTGQWLGHVRNNPEINGAPLRYVVGDMVSDMKFATNIDATPIFVTCGLNSVSDALYGGLGACVVALDLSWAVEYIFRSNGMEVPD